MKILTAYYVESPLFEIVTEDGIGSTFNLQIVCEGLDGTRYTHFKTFDRFDVKGAERFVDAINDRGEIDPSHWHEGTSWDYYAVPQTYEEEKAEALAMGL